MGYSIAVPLKSAKALEVMADFLRKHVRPWHVVSPGSIDPRFDPTTFIRVGDELAYDSGRKIGFNYSTNYRTFAYMAGILRWVALRVGRTHPFKEYGIVVSVPYIVYDGVEGRPVLLRSQWDISECSEETREFLTDDYGWNPAPRPWDKWIEEPNDKAAEDYKAAEELQLREQDRLIRQELQRLTALWDAR